MKFKDKEGFIICCYWTHCYDKKAVWTKRFILLTRVNLGVFLEGVRLSNSDHSTNKPTVGYLWMLYMNRIAAHQYSCYSPLTELMVQTQRSVHMAIFTHTQKTTHVWAWVTRSCTIFLYSPLVPHLPPDFLNLCSWKQRNFSHLTAGPFPLGVYFLLCN